MSDHTSELRVRTSKGGVSRFAPGTERVAHPVKCQGDKGKGQRTVSSTRDRRKTLRPLRSSWNPAGLAIYLLYLLVLLPYFYVRSFHTLDLGPYWWYGLVVLLGELMGASAVVLYGLCIVRKLPDSEGGFRETGSADPPGDMNYKIQILIPCYSEALDIVAETVWAAHIAQLPAGCTSTVWLLDDGRDAAKQAWVRGLACSDIRYVSGRKRGKDEVNGKAGNLNNILEKLYPSGGSKIPGTELVAVFDCDQVCNRDFFLHTLPLLDGAPDVALVLTPQRFGNLEESADIFNHANRHFWEVMIPGLTAWGMVVCTGSNLILRASALQEVGHFPAATVTEDHALGLALARKGFRARYLAKYLATGEAPEEGAIFRQRSRWCKGHLQAFLSKECPLLQSQLPWMLRLLYFSGTWSYLTASFCTPLFAAVPFVAITVGIFPIALLPQYAAIFVPYFFLTHAVIYFNSSLGLLRALWFGTCATQILWYTYLKALWNTGLFVLGLKKKARFKTTVKTGVSAATAADAAGDLAAPGTPRCLSRTVTPSSIPLLLGMPHELVGAPRHRPTASAPDLLKTILPAVLSGSPRAHPMQIAISASSSLRSAEPSSNLDQDVEWATACKPALQAPDPNNTSSETGLQRTLTMPGLQRQMSGGIRPGWNLQISGWDSPERSTGASPAISPSGSMANPKSFDGLRVKSISFGVLRDMWVPLLVLTISSWAVLLGFERLLTVGPRSAAICVSILWAMYNCTGPALLVHYTWLGRGTSLSRAASIAMIASAGLFVAAGAAVWCLTPAQYNYAEVLGLCYQFYEAQRSGPLPITRRIGWRGDSALADKAPDGSSLAGGWYDAGDHLKTSFSIALAASFMAWGILEFPKGHLGSGQTEYARENLRWAADYLIACHLKQDEFVGQVGHMQIDHDFWGRPEDMEAAGLVRPAFVLNATHPGSDVAGQAAAALASASLVFERSDPSFARLALHHAVQLYGFATTFQGSFADSIPHMGEAYPSTAWRDDLAWAAAWLFTSTGNHSYLAQATAWLEQSKEHEADRWNYYALNWDNVLWSTHALLSSRAALSESSALVADFLNRWREGRVVRYTAYGLAYSDDWGTLRNAANSAMLALIYAKQLPSNEAQVHQCWAASQVRYMLGDGKRSFVVGYGKRPPLRPHHRAASCPEQPQPCNSSALHNAGPNPHVLRGALVGGPFLDDAYPDDRADHVKSEVGIEYSAGFTVAVAGMAEIPVSWSVCLQSPSKKNAA